MDYVGLWEVPMSVASWVKFVVMKAPGTCRATRATRGKALEPELCYKTRYNPYITPV